jgi:hypothetical protein
MSGVGAERGARLTPLIFQQTRGQRSIWSLYVDAWKCHVPRKRTHLALRKCDFELFAIQKKLRHTQFIIELKYLQLQLISYQIAFSDP